jgi:hypothetical protein
VKNIWLILLFLTSSVLAAEISFTNTWDGTNLDGWYCSDSSRLSNSNNYLNIKFDAQSIPIYEELIAQRNVSKFIITNISFRLMFVNDAPSYIKICLHAANGNRIWTSYVDGYIVGNWVNCNILVNDVNWNFGPYTDPLLFRNDLNDLDWVGFKILRSGNIIEQNYGIDDFVVNGHYYDSDGDGMPDEWEMANNLNSDVNDALLDSDNDGMSNYNEYRAGTNPRDSNSRLEMRIGRSNDVVILYWSSVLNRFYSLEHSTDLMAGFSILQSNIIATPPTNSYEDVSTNQVKFYKVIVE